MRNCFGRAALQEIRNHSVICSGVLLGTPAAFAALSVIATLVRGCRLDKMSDQVRAPCALLLSSASLTLHIRRWSLSSSATLPPTTFLSADQASLNYAIYHPDGLMGGRQLRSVRQPRGTGFTNTVGIFKGSERTLKFEREHMAGGLILNSDGAPSAVVHQYDRILKSTGGSGTFGKTKSLLRIKVVDDALGGAREDGSWLMAGA